MGTHAIPDFCPKCGSDRLVRILWCYGSLSDEDLKAIGQGRAILGLSGRYRGKNHCDAVPGVRVHRLDRSRLPAWACRNCAPKWSDLHWLAVKEWELEAGSGTAIDWGNDRRAAEILEDPKQADHAQEIWWLIRTLAPDALIDE